MSAKSIHAYLNAIRPPMDVPDAAKFKYPELESIVERDFKDQYDTIDEIYDRYDADDEEALDIRLSHEYLLIVALKLQQALTDEERELWSRRYTEMSIEIFGRPWVDKAAAIAAADLPKLRQLATSSDIDPKLIETLLTTYENLAQLAPVEDGVSSHEQLLKYLNGYLRDKFSDAYAIIDGDDTDILTIDHIRELFEQVLENLGWTAWSVAFDDTAQMSVSPQRKTINLGAYTPALTRKRVRSLFTHEVLTHAHRAVNGAEYDKNLAYGLPGYLTAEEGLAVLMETAIEGHLPDRIGDRYVDITLALGTAVTPQMSRFDMFKMALTRMLLRQAQAPFRADHATLRRLAWQHVNRIYRGSLGNEFVGVFTKDAAYYRGYQEMANYLSRYQGKWLDRAIEFVLSGKFDPTKPTHRLYVHSRRFNAEYGLENLET